MRRTGRCDDSLGGGSGAGADARHGGHARRPYRGEQQEKAKKLKPYAPNKAEVLGQEGRGAVPHRQPALAPVLPERLPAAGSRSGRATSRHVGGYNTLDVRGSYTLSGYKRIEAEFLAPRLFDRRGTLSRHRRLARGDAGRLLRHRHRQHVERRPRQLRLPAAVRVGAPRACGRRGGCCSWPAASSTPQWDQRSGAGLRAVGRGGLHARDAAGLGAKVTYLHTQGTAAFDWRTSPGYSGSGGYYGVTLHDFADHDDAYRFRQVDYEAIQHIPLFRDAWVLSLHGRVETTYVADDEGCPSSCCRRSAAARACAASRAGASAIATACCCRPSGACSSTTSSTPRSSTTPARSPPAGRTSTSRACKTDYGIGFRLHGPLATPLRIELAKSNEGLALVFSLQGRVLRS